MSRLRRPLRGDLRNTVILGLGVLALFVAIGVGWASTAPLTGAVIAQGTVVLQGSRKTIQHLEGGIIGKIVVADGDRVVAGDTLVVMDDVRVKAQVEELRNRLRTLAGIEARLRAERDGAEAIDFTHETLADRTDAEVQAVVAQQINQFIARRENLESRRAILSNRVSQIERQIEGTERQLVGVRRQLKLIRREIKSIKQLVDKGLERVTRLYSLQRDEAELLAQEGELLSGVAQSEEQIGETQLRILNLKTEMLEEVDSQLAEIQASRIGAEKQYVESLDEFDRTDVISPVDGTVLDLRFKTAGGVVRPGEVLMDIVPSSDELVVLARVSPRDIDDVRVGLDAYVVFPSFAQRHLRRISAKVARVSADSLEDERRQEMYFETEVNVDMASLQAVAPEIELTPGLPAEVYITTVERTFLDYVVQPVQQIFERSFREK